MRISHLLLLCTLVPFTGCASTPQPSETRLVKLDADVNRDTDQARAFNEQAAESITRSDFTGAEGLLKQAILADADYGPAHNNLGVVYFNKSKLYQAAREFLLAAALMPRDPEPRNGLGLVFESSNRFDDAIAYYDRAAALDPENIEYVANSARAHVRRGDQSDELRAMLVKIVADDQRSDWNRWARETLSRLNRSSR
jgi:Flp pilus assembly protein TadD